MTYKTLHDIRARVTARWKHPRCKFQRGDHAQVSAQVLPRQYAKMDGGVGEGHSYVSRKKQTRVGEIGRVIAVSCTRSGNIRGDGVRQSRMFTRYYIQSQDGEILGYDSHHLTAAFSLKSLTQ